MGPRTRNGLLGSVSSVLIAGLCMAAPPPQCERKTTLVTELGERKRISRPFPAGLDVTAVPDQPHQGARYLRVRIVVEDPGTCRWFLTVRDGEFHVVETIASSEFAGAAGRRRWTTRVSSAQVFFDLEACSGSGRPKIKFDEYVVMPENAKLPYYSKQGPEEAWRPLYKAANASRRLGDSIGFFMAAWGEQVWVCSGVMLASDLFLTNWHCGGPEQVAADNGGSVPFPKEGLWHPQILDDALIDLSFDDDRLSREYAVRGVAAKDEALDFVLLEVTPLQGMGPARPVRIGDGALATGQRVSVVHHPEGKPKQISTDCQIADSQYPGWRAPERETELSHRCDTEAGSSGGALFNERGELVGLHHLGFRFDPGTCTQTDRENKAVRMDAIVTHLKGNAPLVWGRISP